jgi:glycosyltransferase involved in cell wall biosynthesis
MTINFIAGKFNEGRASHRLRGKHISENLLSKGVDTYWGSKMGKIKKDDITIFLKNSSPAHIKEAKSIGSITVYDLCDNKFDEDELLIPCCQEADYITCNSNIMNQQIRERLNKNSTVIPDPYERPELLVNFNPGKTVKLLWFGSGSSLGYVDWISIWSELETKIVHYTLDIVSSKSSRFKEKTERRILKNETGYQNIGLDKIKFHEWDWNLQGKLMAECDMILLPVDVNHYRTITKSANRIVDSLASGKFILTSRLDSYKEFADFVWSKDIIKGINWAKSNPDAVNKMVSLGQEYTKKFYSIDTISNKWLNFFKTIKNDFT